MESKLNRISRVLLVIAAIGLVIVLFTPIWRIELNAPQYPEGLNLAIHSTGLKGNVDIINGLNHYIGMKTLHNEDFIEFTVLPYIIIFFVIAFILVAAVNKSNWLYILFWLFVSFGIIAMVDFWRWEYNYGHNLNPDAAIVVPGMAYQPPLIGFKQLLNFGAYSIPGTGGWIFVGVGVILLFCTFRTWQIKKKNKLAASLIVFFTLISIPSCNTGPEPIKAGIDHCDFCKMTISDVQFGGEVITKKGKIYKFDEVHCVLSFLKAPEFDKSKVKDIYFTDFSNGHPLIKATGAFFLRSDAFRTPMGGNIAVFSNMDSLKKIVEFYPGNILRWKEVFKL